MEPKKSESDLVDPNKSPKKISRERKKYVKEHTLESAETGIKQ